MSTTSNSAANSLCAKQFRGRTLRHSKGKFLQEGCRQTGTNGVCGGMRGFCSYASQENSYQLLNGGDSAYLSHRIHRACCFLNLTYHSWFAHTRCRVSRGVERAQQIPSRATYGANAGMDFADYSKEESGKVALRAVFILNAGKRKTFSLECVARSAEFSQARETRSHPCYPTRPAHSNPCPVARGTQYKLRQPKLKWAMCDTHLFRKTSARYRATTQLRQLASRACSLAQ